jgi:hypothetical protein
MGITVGTVLWAFLMLLLLGFFALLGRAIWRSERQNSPDRPGRATFDPNKEERNP